MGLKISPDVAQSIVKKWRSERWSLYQWYSSISKDYDVNQNHVFGKEVPWFHDNLWHWLEFPTEVPFESIVPTNIEKVECDFQCNANNVYFKCK